MRNIMRTKVIAGGCLLLGLLAGVAGGQAIESGSSRKFVSTGLFSVSSGGEANFHVSLDDHRDGPPATIFLQAFDENGTSIVRREVTLQAGQSATLRIPGPGLFRAHAGIAELPSLPLTDRRAVVGSVEVSDTSSLTIRSVCTIDQRPTGDSGNQMPPHPEP